MLIKIDTSEFDESRIKGYTLAPEFGSYEAPPIVAVSVGKPVPPSAHYFPKAHPADKEARKRAEETWFVARRLRALKDGGQ
ncbi:hypothetical protein [Brachymonas denitrificans]|uniref:hypothetical protein n=1 Tax=Brachymonas denitrificans TaxID=28220 RepID=UPI00321FD96A